MQVQFERHVFCLNMNFYFLDQRDKQNPKKIRAASGSSEKTLDLNGAKTANRNNYLFITTKNLEDCAAS